MIGSLLMIIASCTVGELESYPDLGNGYYLMGQDNSATAIAKEIKSGVYNPIILGQILEYAYDKKFIVVYRNASLKAKLFFFNDPKWEEQKGKDSLQYWIIEKDKNKVWGPLNKQEYKRERDSLKISEKIHLKE